MENPCQKYEVDIDEMRRLAGFINTERLLHHQGNEMNALCLFYGNHAESNESFADICSSGRTYLLEKYLDKLDSEEEKGIELLIEKNNKIFVFVMVPINNRKNLILLPYYY